MFFLNKHNCFTELIDFWIYGSSLVRRFFNVTRLLNLLKHDIFLQQVMVETIGTVAWCAEILQARSAAATSRAQVAAMAALAAATDRCRDLVAITDDQQRILVSIGNTLFFMKVV